MDKNFLLWASLTIAIIVAINEVWWLGRTGLAWAILGLSVALGLLCAYLLNIEVRIKIKLLYAGLATGIILIVLVIKLLAPAPEFTTDQVKDIVQRSISSSNLAVVVSADYKGQGIWQVKTHIGATGPTITGRWYYLIFNEKTGSIALAP